jgi:hypothetical protein
MEASAMYRYERALAEEHMSDMRTAAERRRLAVLARCCSGVAHALSSAWCRLRGERRTA